MSVKVEQLVSEKEDVNRINSECVVRIDAQHIRYGVIYCEYFITPHSVNISEITCNYISDAEISDAGISDADDNDAGTTDANDSDAGDSTGDKDQLGSGDVDADDTTVCGTDGKTYPSVCHLLQNTVNEHVLHAGRCNASQCSGGRVSLITIHGITNHSFLPRLLRNSKLQCNPTLD